MSTSSPTPRDAAVAAALAGAVVIVLGYASGIGLDPGATSAVATPRHRADTGQQHRVTKPADPATTAAPAPAAAPAAPVPVAVPEPVAPTTEPTYPVPPPPTPTEPTDPTDPTEPAPTPTGPDDPQEPSDACGTTVVDTLLAGLTAPVRSLVAELLGEPDDDAGDDADGAEDCSAGHVATTVARQGTR